MLHHYYHYIYVIHKNKTFFQPFILSNFRSVQSFKCITNKNWAQVGDHTCVNQVKLNATCFQPKWNQRCRKEMESHTHPLSKKSKAQTAYTGGHNTEVAYIWKFSSNKCSTNFPSLLSSHLLIHKNKTFFQSFILSHFRSTHSFKFITGKKMSAGGRSCTCKPGKSDMFSAKVKTLA